MPDKTYEWLKEFRKAEASFDIQLASLPKPSRKSKPSELNDIARKIHERAMWFKNEIEHICLRAIESIVVTDKTKWAMETRDKENKSYESIFVTANKYP